jgi:hypothetical protein
MAVLVLLPLLILSVNDSWIFSYPAAIDAWVYFGYFSNLEDHWQAFRDVYYGTRLSWILPGAFAHAVLPLIPANYALHLAVYYAFAWALYDTLSRTEGRRTALLVGVLTGSYSYWLFAAGWNYVDGVGVAYYAMAVALMTRHAQLPRRLWRMAGAGALFGAAVHSNIVWLALVPALLVYYAHLTQRADPVRWWRIAAWFVAGGLFTTTLIGLESLRRGGDFLFFMPSLHFAVAGAFVADQYGSRSAWWVLDAPWLVVPACAAAGALHRRLRLWSDADAASRALLDHGLVSAATLLALTLVGRPLLQFPYYVSFLIPSLALALAPQLRPALMRLSSPQYVAVVLTALLFVPLMFAPPIARSLLAVDAGGIVAGALTLMGAAFMGLAVRTNVLTLVLWILAFAATNVITADRKAFPVSDAIPRRDSFVAVARADAALKTLDPESRALFWYDRLGRLGDEFESVASTRVYWWEQRLLSDRFPQRFNRLLNRDAEVAPGESIVVLGDDSTRALADARATLAPLGLQVSLAGTHLIAEGDARFTMTLLRTGIDPMRVEAPRAISAEIFRGRQVAGPPARLEIVERENRVSVRSTASTHDWQAVSETITVEPGRRYLLEFDLTIESGGAGIHLVAAPWNGEVLAFRTSCRAPVNGRHYLSFTASRANQMAIVLSNCGSPVAVVNEFSVSSIQLRAYR